MRPTLLVVAVTSDEYLLQMAGTMIRYAWQGIRTVLVTVEAEAVSRPASVMERAAALLGTEQLFQWRADGAVAQRIARTIRAFHPHILLTTPSMRTTCRHAWQMATDVAITMPGLAMPPATVGSIWYPAMGNATIDVPFTEGLRHAVACLFTEGKANPTSLCRTIGQRQWAPAETFARDDGSVETPISDFFGTAIV